jgi:hypothetical protein
MSGDRLGDDSPPRGDLVQVQVREAVLDEQSSVALLEIDADRRIAEVDQLAVEHQLGGCQQVLFAPTGGNRRSGQILERRGAEGLGEGSLALIRKIARESRRELFCSRRLRMPWISTPYEPTCIRTGALVLFRKSPFPGTSAR